MDEGRRVRVEGERLSGKEEGSGDELGSDLDLDPDPDPDPWKILWVIFTLTYFNYYVCHRFCVVLRGRVRTS